MRSNQIMSVPAQVDPIVEHDLAQYCRQLGERARAAARRLATVSGAAIDAWLRDSADALCRERDRLLAANELDLQKARDEGLHDAVLDRLRLTPQRIEGIAEGLRQLAYLPRPVGEVIESSVRPNGLQVMKVRVPLGVVFFIYESRPNVTADAAAICLKSGNAVILRGGKEAFHSSSVIVEILQEIARQHHLPQDAIQMVTTTDRQAVGYLLSMADMIDVVIPRGGESLIRRVAAEARMPVIKHFSGNCHVYVDRSADLDQAISVTVNAKCQRMGVCNACESLLVHTDVAEQFLPRLAEALRPYRIELRGDERTRQLVPTAVPATEEDYFAEYLGPVLSVKIVHDLSEAIEHINHYGSHHTDAILTRDLNAARRFVAEVDSAAVMVNASTRFHDGGEFGLGAEIGISTDKFHARGPCGLRELTTYKWIVYGEGHVRQ
jgi:glutamate-5-semialdehyde dehydrogenase